MEYFLLGGIIVGFTFIYIGWKMSYIKEYGKCPKAKGLFKSHELVDDKWKWSEIKDSGLVFPFKYCIDKKCIKCGEVFPWQNYKDD